MPPIFSLYLPKHSVRTLSIGWFPVKQSVQYTYLSVNYVWIISLFPVFQLVSAKNQPDSCLSLIFLACSCLLLGGLIFYQLLSIDQPLPINPLVSFPKISDCHPWLFSLYLATRVRYLSAHLYPNNQPSSYKSAGVSTSIISHLCPISRCMVSTPIISPVSHNQCI
jgi:hypothetical protein